MLYYAMLCYIKVWYMMLFLFYPYGQLNSAVWGGSAPYVGDEAWRQLFAQHSVPVDVRHVVQVLQLRQAGDALLHINAHQLGGGEMEDKVCSHEHGTGPVRTRGPVRVSSGRGGGSCLRRERGQGQENNLLSVGLDRSSYTHIQTHTHTQTHMHKHTCTHTRMHRHIQTHTHAQIHVQTHTHLYKCIHTCIHTHIRTQAHPHKQTQAHTHKRTQHTSSSLLSRSLFLALLLSLSTSFCPSLHLSFLSSSPSLC